MFNKVYLRPVTDNMQIRANSGLHIKTSIAYGICF